MRNLSSPTMVSNARRQLARLVIGVAVVGIVLAVLFLLWADVGVRSVRGALVEETERQSLALLQSLILASQYSLATGSLAEKLEREATAERTRALLDRYPLGKVSVEDLNSLAEALEAQAVSLRIGTQWISSIDGVPTTPSTQAGAKLRTVQVAHEPLEILQIDSVSGRGWRGLVFDSDQGDVVVWAISDTWTSKPAIRGIGELIQQIGKQSGINYIMLQAPDGIIFASRHLKPVLKLSADSFLVAVLENDMPSTREIEFEGTSVLEAAAPFLSTELPSGMFRVGLSLNAVEAAVSRLTLQLGLTALLLVLLSTTAISIVITRRSLSDLGRSYREVETLSGSVLDAIDQAVIAVDADGRLTILNPTAERWFGLLIAQARGRSVSSVLPDEFGLDEVRTTRVPVSEREVSCQTTRDRRTLVYSTTPLVTSDTRHVGAVAVIRDETDARTMANHVRRVERLSAMGQLAAGVAHEIRNPLNAIALAAQQLKLELGSAGAASMADTIWSESKRLNNIVEDFLSLARPSTQPKLTVDWGELINSVAQMARLETDKKSVELRVNIRDGCLVDGVSDELRKALWNLLRNALSATEPGGRIEIDLKAERSVAVLAMVDTGTGIAPEALTRVFEPWFTTKSGGTGLGLAITHRIVQDHEGSIEISSPTPGTNRGTRVVVRLPLSGNIDRKV